MILAPTTANPTALAVAVTGLILVNVFAALQLVFFNRTQSD
jgi:hypothetical protein